MRSPRITADIPAMPEARLLLSVIGQAVDDCRRGDTPDRISAYRWIIGGGHASICDLIGLSAERVREWVIAEYGEAPAPAMRTCKVCGQTLPADLAHFYRANAGRANAGRALRTACKPCFSAAANAARKAREARRTDAAAVIATTTSTIASDT